MAKPELRGDLRILLVDDDAVDRRVVGRHLSHTGLHHHLRECTDAGEAASLARSGSFDCILMDFRYPKGTAFELFADLLAEPCSSRPPIVLLTGNGGERIAAESIQRGAQEYMNKAELDPESLRAAIESALERSRRQIAVAARDAELERLSFFDALTDLPNRRLFFDRLGQTIRAAHRTREPFAVLMMDLNLFKDVNDTFGHEAGDELLVQVAQRLRGVVRESDTVARLGGDEFAAVLSTASSSAGAQVVAEKISDAVSEPILVAGQVVHVGVSIGIAMYPEHGVDGEDLLRRADTALYAGKRTKQTVTLYGDNLEGQTPEPTSIIHGLRAAVTKKELFALYQPQVRLSDGAVVGVEALVRWRHPELGLLPATKFVPAAERAEVIEGLTYHMLDLALAQCASWREQGQNFTVSVNLSSRLLDRQGLAARIATLVEGAHVPAQSLCLEVTESGIMHSPEAAERTLLELSEVGVRLSIDDFGTGYSSLKYLRNFPIDEIKIDGSFVGGLVHDPKDGVIVESVLALGRAFGVDVLAEGVECDHAWTSLLELGCVLGQGYRFGRPMTALELDQWLEHWNRAEPLPTRGPALKRVVGG